MFALECAHTGPNTGLVGGHAVDIEPVSGRIRRPGYALRNSGIFQIVSGDFQSAAVLKAPLKAAKAIGLSVQSPLLARANEVIE